jgi:hypothetical protein
VKRSCEMISLFEHKIPLGLIAFTLIDAKGQFLPNFVKTFKHNYTTDNDWFIRIRILIFYVYENEID